MIWIKIENGFHKDKSFEVTKRALKEGIYIGRNNKEIDEDALWDFYRHNHKDAIDDVYTFVWVGSNEKK